VHSTELSRGSEKDEELDIKGGECALEMNGSKRSRFARYLLCGIVCAAIIVCLAVWLWPKPQLEIVSLDVETKVQYVEFMGWEYDVLATIGVRNTGNRKGRPHFYLSIPQKDSTESVWGWGEQYELKPNETAHITKELFLGEGSYTLEVLDQDHNPTRLRKSFEVRKPSPPEFRIKRFDVKVEGSFATVQVGVKNESDTVATFLPYLNTICGGKHCRGGGVGSLYLAPGEEDIAVNSHFRCFGWDGERCIVSLYAMEIYAYDSWGHVTGRWEVEFDEIVREFGAESY
jgi:hypothetical protein